MWFIPIVFLTEYDGYVPFHAVYRIPCECGLIYIGETGRNLEMRQTEHLAFSQKSLKEKSTVAKHTWELDDAFKWKESKLITPVSNYFARKLRESIEIYKQQIIQQEGRPLNDIWTVLL